MAHRLYSHQQLALEPALRGSGAQQGELIRNNLDAGQEDWELLDKLALCAQDLAQQVQYLLTLWLLWKNCLKNSPHPVLGYYCPANSSSPLQVACPSNRT